MKRIVLTLLSVSCFLGGLIAQGSFSGSLEMNANVFLRDSVIGAVNTPQYDNQLSGGEFWLNLNYNNKGFDIGLRYDGFYNSNLKNPQGSYTAQGIGYWHIRKKINKLDITVGHLYDQIGSGVIFRAYEARPLFIDNALVGVRLGYDLIDKDAFSLQAKAFMGRQRQPFTNNSNEILPHAYRQNIRGIAFDGYWKKEGGKVALAPGAGFVNRTLDDNLMNNIAASVNTYATDRQFIPKYNTYAATLYNTLTAGNFTWYIEGAYKTKEALDDPSTEVLELLDGSVVYTSMAYSQKGFGITLEAKRTENFFLRTSPLLTQNEGFMTFIPPMARQNTYRLTSRYNAATQEFGELAFQWDIRYSPKKRLTFNLFGSYIDDLDNNPLFREAHLNVRYRKPKKYSMVGGVQYLVYSQERYEVKPNVPLVKAFAPYVDYLHKFNRKHSLRTELQYMYTEQDYGQWAFALLEYSFAPHWIITASDMVNTKSTKTDEIHHYPTLGVVYSHKSNRFTLSYVKQVEGVVCTGGVCRLEPAFSGVKFGVTSSF